MAPGQQEVICFSLQRIYTVRRETPACQKAWNREPRTQQQTAWPRLALSGYIFSISPSLSKGTLGLLILHTLLGLVKSYSNTTGNKCVNTSNVVWRLSNSMAAFTQRRSRKVKYKPNRRRFRLQRAMRCNWLLRLQKHMSACKSGPLMINGCLNNHLTATVERVPDENINSSASCQCLMMRLNVGRVFDSGISHS